jgi:hypothetical protein
MGKHTALTAPLVLHHTRIYKRAMKKIIFNSQMRNPNFLIVIYHSSLVKAIVNAARVCKLRSGVKKASISSFFNGQKRNKDHSALVNCGGMSFGSLDRRIYDCKLRNKKKTFNPRAQRIFSAAI